MADGAGREVDGQQVVQRDPGCRRDLEAVLGDDRGVVLVEDVGPAAVDPQVVGGRGGGETGIPEGAVRLRPVGLSRRVVGQLVLVEPNRPRSPFQMVLCSW